MPASTPSPLWRCQVPVEYAHYVLGHSTEIADFADPSTAQPGGGLTIPVDDDVLSVEVEILLDHDVLDRPHWTVAFAEDASLTGWDGSAATPCSTAILGAGIWAIGLETAPRPDRWTARHILHLAPLDEKSRRWLDRTGESRAEAVEQPQAHEPPFGGAVIENLPAGRYLLTWSTEHDVPDAPTQPNPGLHLHQADAAVTIDHTGRGEWWILVDDRPQPTGDKWIPAISAKLPPGARLRALTTGRQPVRGLPDPIIAGPLKLNLYRSNPLNDWGTPRRTRADDPEKLRIDLITPRA